MNINEIAEAVKIGAAVLGAIFAAWLVIAIAFFIRALRQKNWGDSPNWREWCWVEIQIGFAALFTPWWALPTKARILHLDQVARHRGWDKA